SAQSQGVGTPPAFEVASVKPSSSGLNSFRGSCHGIDSKYGLNETPPPLGRCVITDARLSHLIFMAFRLRVMSWIRNAPDWVMNGPERFTVEAKAEDPAKTTEDQLLRMLQALVVERFKIKYHRDSVDLPGFALVIAKNGPKLHGATGKEIMARFGP